MKKLLLLIFFTISLYGCASSSRVDVLADQIRAQQIKMQTLEDLQAQNESQTVSIYNRMASHEAKIVNLNEQYNSLSETVNNLSSKFDSKFRQNLMK